MSENNKVEDLTESLKTYINTNLELMKLEAVERVSSITSGIIFSFLILIIVSSFIFFASLALGFYLSAYFGNNYSGFIIIAAFYLLALLIFILFRKKIIDGPIRNNIIQKLLHKF